MHVFSGRYCTSQWLSITLAGKGTLTIIYTKVASHFREASTLITAFEYCFFSTADDRLLQTQQEGV